MTTATLGFDYVVVGGGTAGCVLASRLSEDAAARVCLIEAGGRARHPAAGVPMLNFITSALAGYQWGWRAEPDRGLAGRQLSYAQAKVLGGGSAINGMLHAPGDAEDYAAWRVPGWGYDDVAPFAARAADRLHVAPAGALTPLCEMFLAAAEGAGHPRLASLAGRTADGVGYFDYAIHRGRRSAVAGRYLDPSRRRANLTVLSRAQVLRVLIEGGRAVGVEVLQDGSVRDVRAGSEVTLCAGGLGSPRLLMLSGIGPAEDLAKAGIAALVDRSEVGGNLQNHVRIKLAYRTQDTPTVRDLMSPMAAIKAGMSYVIGHGALGRSVLTAGGLIRSAPGLAEPDIGVIFSPGLMGAGAGLLGPVPREDGFSVFVRQARPWSRGALRLGSADPLAAPIIETRYFSDQRDMAVFLGGLRRTRAIFARPEIARVIAKGDESELTPETVARTAGHAFHPSGACRLGHDADSVVDADLRVRGVERLRIADSSVIPVIPKAGTNAPAMIIAERAAAMMHSGN
jgi:choline dehydrogenase